MATERRSADRNSLTQERLQEILHYEQKTGVFTWKVAISNRVKVGDGAGWLNADGYIQISIYAMSYMSHRLAWLYMKGEWPRSQIDHINGVRDDNRFVNLRNVTSSENCQNRREAKSNNATGFLGVTFNKLARKYRAQIMIDGKYKYLGCFLEPQAAHEAYLVAKRGLHSTCTI